MSSFENLRVVDNFYQTSLFFPMPTVVISTLCEDGSTTLGPYSLVQPYYVAGKDYYAMLLSCRNSSNTAQNILRNGKCALDFVDDKPKTFAECVKLSWPGDKPEDKMPNCNFKLEPGQAEGERPMVLTDDALETILNVPRVFLPLVLKGCVDRAKENGVELIDATHMQIINDKRAKEKNKK